MSIIRRSLCLVLVFSALPLSAAPPGTVVAWGRNDYGQTNVPAGLNDVIAIAAGGAHTVALRSNGTVVAWGRNDFGQTDVPAGLTGVTAISAGYLHTVALKSDGTVVAWGSNASGQTKVPPGLSGVTAVAAGSVHTVALKNDGTVVPWGREEISWGDNSTFVNPAQLRGVIAIAAGYVGTSLALKDDGTIGAWGGGDDDFGVFRLVSQITDAAAIAPYAALRRDGTVVAWGFYEPLVAIPDLSNVVAIDSRIALRRDGTVVTWELGFVGSGPTTDTVRAFAQETGLRRVTAIASGGGSGFLEAPREGGHFVALLDPGRQPIISQQPLNQTVSAGQGVTFLVNASGEGPLSYQWTKDGINLAGATGVSLTLSNVQPGQFGNYALLVTNAYGSVTSNLAALSRTSGGGGEGLIEIYEIP